MKDKAEPSAEQGCGEGKAELVERSQAEKLRETQGMALPTTEPRGERGPSEQPA